MCYGKPTGTMYTGPGTHWSNCPFACGHGFYPSSGDCLACINKPANSLYISTGTSAIDCLWKCNPGFFHGLTNASLLLCLGCPPNTYYHANTTETTLKACICNLGFTCSYQSRIMKTIRLNMPLSAFSSDVQQNLINAIAKAAQVQPSQISILSSAGVARRRLLKMQEIEIVICIIGSWSRFTESSIRAHFHAAKKSWSLLHEPHQWISFKDDLWHSDYSLIVEKTHT